MAFLNQLSCDFLEHLQVFWMHDNFVPLSSIVANVNIVLMVLFTLWIIFLGVSDNAYLLGVNVNIHEVIADHGV